MHKVLQVFLSFSLVSSIRCVRGEDVKCICSDKNVTFISTKSDESTSENQIKNIISEQWNSIIETEINRREELLNKQKDYNLNRRFTIPMSCAEATANSRRTGIYNVQTEVYGSKSFQVSCEEELYGGGWTIVLRRIDGSIDFFRNWTDYKHGFGNLEGEFFIGLDKLHALTNGPYTQELIFVLEDFENEQRYAKYSSFSIGDENERYALKTLGKYSGDAGDSFRKQAGQTFKTKDVEDKLHHCAQIFTGAWWYKNCHHSNLCGLYLSGNVGFGKYGQGVIWYTFRGHYYSLKSAIMMIRPQRTELIL